MTAPSSFVGSTTAPPITTPAAPITAADVWQYHTSLVAQLRCAEELRQQLADRQLDEQQARDRINQLSLWLHKVRQDDRLHQLHYVLGRVHADNAQNPGNPLCSSWHISGLQTLDDLLQLLLAHQLPRTHNAGSITVPQCLDSVDVDALAEIALGAADYFSGLDDYVLRLRDEVAHASRRLEGAAPSSAAQPSRKRRKGLKPADTGNVSRVELLVSALESRHLGEDFGSGSDSEPLLLKEITELTGMSDATVSRAIRDFFGAGGMKAYQRLCCTPARLMDKIQSHSEPQSRSRTTKPDFASKERQPAKRRHPK